MQYMIHDHELARRMGVPSTAELERTAPGLAARVRSLLESCAAPYTFSHTVEIDCIERDSVRLACGTILRGDALARRLGDAKAHALVVLAWSAGDRIDHTIARLWAEGRMDDAYALDAMAAALVEQMRSAEAERVCAEARDRDMAALAPYAPGYDGWPLDDQKILYEVLLAAGGAGFTSKIRCLDSGMLDPKMSLLGVMGLTRHRNLVPPQEAPCRSCAMPRCTMRRYSFPRKALERWSRDLLVMDRHTDGSVDARFRMEGSTCGNTSLAIDFHVSLIRHAATYRIVGGDCRPSPDDRGCAHMCCATREPLNLIFERAAREQPLAGQTLAAALDWNPSVNPAGCICGQEALHHKWRIAYHTIAYALEKHEIAD